MRTTYTFTLGVQIIAAVLYIVALQFCSGKTIPIKTTNVTVAQTTVGIDDLNVMQIQEQRNNVLEISITCTYANAQKSSTCALISRVTLLSMLVKIHFRAAPNNEIQNMWFLGSAQMCL